MTAINIDADTLTELATASMIDNCINEITFLEEGENGLTARTVKVPPASPSQLSHYVRSEFRCTGLVWRALSDGERIVMMQEFGLPVEAALSADINDALPKDTKDDLAFWQAEINSGRCWFAPGSVGRHAHALIEQGYLLWGPKPISNYYGAQMPSRDERPGSQGSPTFVATMMSPAYAAWIAAI